MLFLKNHVWKIKYELDRDLMFPGINIWMEK